MALVLVHPAIAKAGNKKPKEELPLSNDTSFMMSASYDPDNATMKITMLSGSEYIYSNIDPSTFARFKESRNKGKFYADEIRGVEKATRSVNKTIGKPVSKKT